MFRFLGLYSKYKFMFWVGEFFYYSINLSAIIFGWYWISKKLKEMGYGAKQSNLYALLCLLLSFPVGFASSRAAGMFYHPVSKWSFDFFLENMFHGRTHTFHGSLILPILLYLVYGLIFRFKIWHLLDTVFLYIPLGHAIGRVSCLIVGCCWGHRVTVHLYGLSLSFQNPTPLWAVGFNLCIYYFLKQLHGHVYFNPGNSKNYSGSIAASYLVLYGVDRLFMEFFRTEKIISYGLTQAQVTMLSFMFIGISIFIYINFLRADRLESSFIGQSAVDTGISIGKLMTGFVMVNLCPLLLYYIYKSYYLLYMLIMQEKGPAFTAIPPLYSALLIGLAVILTVLFYFKYLKKEEIPAAADSEKDREHIYPQNIQPLILLASFIGLTLFLLSLFYYLVMKMRLLPFPFQRVSDVTTAYKLILTYLPCLVLPVISVIWLKKAQLPLAEKFKIRGSLKTILIFTTIGLGASLFYTLDLLVFKGPRLRGIAFWPPVLILSVINAFTEEIAYRLTTYSLVLNADFSRITAILVQALLYSAIHFFYNPSLGALSLLYGIIMGILMDRTQSVTLCIICHFIIDLGAIGRPILAF